MCFGPSETEEKAVAQQIAANEFFMGVARDLIPESKRRMQEERAFLKHHVDPKLKSYMKRGFAPGERPLLRRSAREDLAVGYKDSYENTMRNLHRLGVNKDAPSGTMARVATGLSNQFASDQGRAMREIDQAGAERRFASLGVGLGRADKFAPLSYTATAYGGRAQPVAFNRFRPSFMENLAGGLFDKGMDAGFGALSGLLPS